MDICPILKTLGQPVYVCYVNVLDGCLTDNHTTSPLLIKSYKDTVGNINTLTFPNMSFKNYFDNQRGYNKNGCSTLSYISEKLDFYCLSALIMKHAWSFNALFVFDLSSYESHLNLITPLLFISVILKQILRY